MDPRFRGDDVLGNSGSDSCSETRGMTRARKLGDDVGEKYGDDVPGNLGVTHAGKR